MMMMKNWTCKTEFPLKHSASASLAGNLPWDPTKDEAIHHDTPLDTVPPCATGMVVTRSQVQSATCSRKRDVRI